MNISDTFTRWGDYVYRRWDLVVFWLKEKRSWLIAGLVAVLVSGCGVAAYWHRENLRTFAQHVLRVPQLAMVKLAPTPQLDTAQLAVLEQRVDDLNRQYQADSTYRQQLTTDFQAAMQQVSGTNDQLVKQGQQLSQAVQDVQAEVQTLSGAGVVPVVGTAASDSSAASTLDTSSPSASSSPVATKININTASADQLDTLPGIGPSYAQAIITYRMQHGPFKTIQDITNVTGIGDATFKKLQDQITV